MPFVGIEWGRATFPRRLRDPIVKSDNDHSRATTALLKKAARAKQYGIKSDLYIFFVKRSDGCRIVENATYRGLVGVRKNGFPVRSRADTIVLRAFSGEGLCFTFVWQANYNGRNSSFIERPKKK